MKCCHLLTQTMVNIPQNHSSRKIPGQILEVKFLQSNETQDSCLRVELTKGDERGHPGQDYLINSRTQNHTITSCNDLIVRAFKRTAEAPPPLFLLKCFQIIEAFDLYKRLCAYIKYQYFNCVHETLRKEIQRIMLTSICILFFVYKYTIFTPALFFPICPVI